jgi:hypothetical protein
VSKTVATEAEGAKLHISIALDLDDLRAVVREAIREELRALPQAEPALFTKAQIARAIGVSVATIDRFDREGAPHERVGVSKRYDLARYREWLAGRGSVSTTKTPRASNVIDLEAERLLERAGLRAGGAR